MTIDLTDYVNVGARAYIEAHSVVDWEKIPEMSNAGINRHDLREYMLPVVQAVIEAYVEAHPETDIAFLEGIG
jgi:hypothetical protein